MSFPEQDKCTCTHAHTHTHTHPKVELQLQGVPIQDSFPKAQPQPQVREFPVTLNSMIQFWVQHRVSIHESKYIIFKTPEFIYEEMALVNFHGK